MQKITVSNIVYGMGPFYAMGMSLKDIYDITIEQHGHVYGPILFSEFVKKSRDNKSFMKEFEKTCFIESI